MAFTINTREQRHPRCGETHAARRGGLGARLGARGTPPESIGMQAHNLSPGGLLAAYERAVGGAYPIRASIHCCPSERLNRLDELLDNRLAHKSMCKVFQGKRRWFITADANGWAYYRVDDRSPAGRWRRL